MAASSVFADVERLRYASGIYRSGSAEVSEAARALSSLQTPAMPPSTQGIVASTLAQVSRELSALSRSFGEESTVLGRTATLFEEANRPRPSSAGALSSLFARYGVLPIGQGLVEAMYRLRVVGASRRAVSYVRRVPDARVARFGTYGVFQVLGAALDLVEGMNTQLALDMNDPSLASASTQELYARAGFRGISQAAGGVVGAQIGGKIGLALGAGLGPVGAIAGFVIGSALGGMAGAYIGGQIAEAMLRRRGSSPNSVRRKPEIEPPPKKGSIEPPPKRNDPPVLSQLDPMGRLLDKKVQVDGRTIRVKDHIKSYGCLMTDYTMLLNSQGIAADVSELYAANYDVNPAHAGSLPFVAQGEPVPVADMLWRDVAIKKVAPDLSIRRGTLSAGTEIETLRQVVSDKSVIVHVQSTATPRDGHWIVVDRAAPDGSFTVRDPARGLIEKATFGPKGYQFFQDGPGQTRFTYLVKG